MAKWTMPRGAKKAAQETFPQHKPNVTPIGERQYLLSPTPYGAIVLIPVRAGYLVAAEQPPEGQAIDAGLLEPRLVAHLVRNNLRPWRVVSSHEVTDVIRDLGRDRGPVPMAGQGAWSPYLCPMSASARLVGETRLRCLEQVKALVAASRGGPLAQIVGMEGVGKRTMAATLAAQCQWNPVELPLGRFFVDRILQTPQELFLETILAGAACLDELDLLVLSDADLLLLLPEKVWGALRGELSRLPQVLLASRPTPTAAPPGEVVSVICPGLECLAEARALLTTEHPGVEFAGAALDMAAGAAHVEGVGIVPKRLLYIVRLSVALAGASANAKVVLSPDDVAEPIKLARKAWINPGGHTLKDKDEA